jgi:hypothetical protein
MASALTAATDTGKSCKVSSRRRAVTTISSRREADPTTAWAATSCAGAERSRAADTAAALQALLVNFINFP